MSVNKVILIGNLGQDPKTGTTNSGKEYANFSIGVNEHWKDKDSGEKKSKTEWANIVAWGGLAKYAAYLKKGSKVYVEGKLQTEQYEKDGQKQYSTKIVLQGFDAKLLGLDSKEGKDSSKAQSDHHKAKANGYQPQEEDDEIPF